MALLLQPLNYGPQNGKEWSHQFKKKVLHVSAALAIIANEIIQVELHLGFLGNLSRTG